MNILSIPKMILTPRNSWPHLEKPPTSLASLFLSLVLPLSALPPLLLYYAGTHYGDAFAAGFGGKPWGTIAIVFFFAEMLTILGMGWFIGQVVAVQEAQISTHYAYMLAGITPTPLWLSSIGLLVPSFAFNAVIVLMALAASCSLIYHGVYTLCHMREETAAAAITHTVMGAVVSAWALLLLGVVAS
ncbi:Yip1 family protein [Candidatus Ferrigenium straubiae]|jgi:hypothetical protein|uniref:Yip1 family protein n=1 Tax=Candidatus Ferrigenium straubiae TaxID=2919506 RepID=UPI003F4ADA72